MTAYGTRDAKLAVCERHRARAVDVDPGAFATTVLVAPAYCVPCRDERREGAERAVDELKRNGRAALRLSIARELLVASKPVDPVVAGMSRPALVDVGYSEDSLTPARHVATVAARASVMLADALLAELERTQVAT